MKRLSFTLLTALFLYLYPGGVPDLLAQDETIGEGGMVSVRFMGWERAFSGLFTSVNAKEFTPVHAPAYVLGRTSIVAGSEKFRLYRKAERAGELLYEVVVEASLPKNASMVRAYLLPKVDTGDGRDVHVVLLAEDPELFKSGEIRIFNFSQHKAALKVGEDKFVLEPLEWRQMTAEPDRKYRVLLATAMNVDGDWTRAGLKILSLRPNYRGEITLVHTTAEISEEGGARVVRQIPRPVTLTETLYIPPLQIEVSENGH